VRRTPRSPPSLDDSLTARLHRVCFCDRSTLDIGSAVASGYVAVGNNPSSKEARAIAGSGARDGSPGTHGHGSKYRTLHDIPAIVYIWGVRGDLEGMTEEYVSPQIEDVLGFRPEEWMADPTLWIARLHPHDRAEVMDETARSVEAGEAFKLEYRMIARDGRVVWLHDVASVLARDDDGKAIRYQGVQLDITARKEAEFAQRRAHEDLRRLDQERRQLVRRLVRAQEEERRRITEGIHDDAMQRAVGVQDRVGLLVRERPDIQEDPAFSGLAQEISDLIECLREFVNSAPAAETRSELWLSDAVIVGEPEDEPSEAAATEIVDLDVSEKESSSSPHLTPREGEVADLLALGHTNAEIGSILHISVRTVEHHRSRMFRKLGVRSRAGVVRALAEMRAASPGTVDPSAG
jgi:PAS domain S-box-containing protein